MCFTLFKPKYPRLCLDFSKYGQVVTVSVSAFGSFPLVVNCQSCVKILIKFGSVLRKNLRLNDQILLTVKRFITSITCSLFF